MSNFIDAFFDNHQYDRKNYKLNVEQFDVTERSEKFKVAGRNKTIILESNRPLFRNKGLKHRNPDFKIISGEIHSSYGIELLKEKILEVVDK